MVIDKKCNETFFFRAKLWMFIVPEENLSSWTVFSDKKRWGKPSLLKPMNVIKRVKCSYQNRSQHTSAIGSRTSPGYVTRETPWKRIFVFSYTSQCRLCCTRNEKLSSELFEGCASVNNPRKYLTSIFMLHLSFYVIMLLILIKIFSKFQ